VEGILDGLTLSEELRIRNHLESDVRALLGEGSPDPVSRACWNGGLLYHHDGSGGEPSNGSGRRFDCEEVSAAVFACGGAHADEDDVFSRQRCLSIDRERESSLGDSLAQELL